MSYYSYYTHISNAISGQCSDCTTRIVLSLWWSIEQPTKRSFFCNQRLSETIFFKLSLITIVCPKLLFWSLSEFFIYTSSGPKVIKLFWVRTHTPNRTPCSKSYSYSRYRGYKTFSYSYSYSGWVQKCDFLSKLWSFLKVVLKTFNLNKMQCKHIILFIL